MKTNISLLSLFIILLTIPVILFSQTTTDTVVIGNKELKIVINKTGAELNSIKSIKKQTEFLWQGNPDYWKQQSPILFPFVGRLWNNEYEYNGKKYPMTTHGFANTKKFELVKRSATEAWFRLTSNEETYSIYPFKFELMIGYVLKQSNLQVIWKVKNTDQKEMYFQIGGHPGFQLQGFNEKDTVNGYIKFEKAKKDIQYIVKEKNNFFLNEQIAHSLHLDKDGLLPITPSLYTNDAVVFEHYQAKKLILLNRKKSPILSLEFDHPVFAIWSPSKKNAPFVCFEPWWGRGDAENFTGDVSKRQWTQQLQPGKDFVSSYTINILEK